MLEISLKSVWSDMQSTFFAFIYVDILVQFVMQLITAASLAGFCCAHIFLIALELSS